MNTIQQSEVFEINQLLALEKGKQNRHRFLEIVEKLSTIRTDDKYPHNFIYGYPGIGKSFEIKNRLEAAGTKFVMVTGNVSMFAFGVQLAVINFMNPNQERIIVFCDDVDTLVANETSCNMLKSALHGPKIFTYEKSLQSQWSNLSELQKEAIKHHQDDEKMGFQVPTNSMSFLIVSNIQLPTDDEVRTIEDVYRSIYIQSSNMSKGMQNVKETFPESALKDEIIQFIESSDKGVIRGMI